MSLCEQSEVGGNKGIIKLSLSGRDYYTVWSYHGSTCKIC